ncbi:MAG: YcxB family protein [Chloroflexi bacterium]|nr:MAG: YcxB family protein [Chloroflexota bacterium]
MEISYKNNFWDTIKFRAVWMLMTPTGLLFTIFIVGYLSFAVFRIVRDVKEGLAVQIILFLIVAGVIGFLFLSFYFFLLLIAWLFRKPQAKQTGLLRTDESGLAYESPMLQMNIKWSAVKKVERSLGLTLIWLSWRSALLIPDRAFLGSAGAATQFFSHVQEKWKANRVNP